MINKFQTGGLVYFNAVANPYSRSAQADMTPQAAGSSKGSSDSGLLSKEIMNELYKKGIPVDVDRFSAQVAELERKIDMGLPVSKSAIYSLKAEANRIIQLCNYLNNAEKRAASNESIGEVAVGSRGELFTMSERGDIKKVSMSTYDVEKDGPALTVGELIEHRKFNPTQAFDTDITQVVAANVGMTKINDYIKKIISIIGSSSSTKEAYLDLMTLLGNGAKRPTQQEFETISDIANEWLELGPDAIFKVTKKVGLKNMREAMAYIIQALPRDMQIQLRGRSVAEGVPFESSSASVMNLITSALAASNDVEDDIKISYDTQMNKLAGTKSGKESGSTKTFYQTPNEALFDGDLNLTVVKLTDNAFGNQTGVYLPGTKMPALTTDDGNAVSNLPMSVALNATIGKYLEKDKIYMGDQKILEGMLNNIAYTNDQVAAVYMPVDGRHNIDWDAFHGFSAAELEIKDKNIAAIEDKNKVHLKYRSYAHYDENGELKDDMVTERFIFTYGYTSSSNIDGNNKMVLEVPKDGLDDIENTIDAIYSKQNKNKFGIGKMEGDHFWSDYVKVPVFIKISEFASHDAYRYAGHGSNMTPRTLELDKLQQVAAQEPQRKLLTDTNLLYNIQ